MRIQKKVLPLQPQNAQVAELVDALVSGTSVRKDVQVRALSRAQKDEIFVFFCFKPIVSQKIFIFVIYFKCYA